MSCLNSTVKVRGDQCKEKYYNVFVHCFSLYCIGNFLAQQQDPQETMVEVKVFDQQEMSGNERLSSRTKTFCIMSYNV